MEELAPGWSEKLLPRRCPPFTLWKAYCNAETMSRILTWMREGWKVKTLMPNGW
jgi:hypothetical protein